MLLQTQRVLLATRVSRVFVDFISKIVRSADLISSVLAANCLQYILLADLIEPLRGSADRGSLHSP